jgi:hypothetical protein
VRETCRCGIFPACRSQPWRSLGREIDECVLLRVHVGLVRSPRGARLQGASACNKQTRRTNKQGGQTNKENKQTRKRTNKQGGQTNKEDKETKRTNQQGRGQYVTERSGADLPLLRRWYGTAIGRLHFCAHLTCHDTRHDVPPAKYPPRHGIPLGMVRRGYRWIRTAQSRIKFSTTTGRSTTTAGTR